MTSKEKLFYLLEQYYFNKYSTEIFADEFTITYDTEIDYDLLTEKENKLLGDLCIITARFSSSAEDLRIPNVYYSERQVKDKATEVYLKLKA
jgi:hypothetical protein